MRKDYKQNCCVCWCNAAPGTQHKPGCKYRWMTDDEFKAAKQRRSSSSAKAAVDDLRAMLVQQLIDATEAEMPLIERKIKLLGGDVPGAEYSSDSSDDDGACSAFVASGPLFTIYEAQPTVHGYTVPPVSAKTARRNVRRSISGRSDQCPVSIRPWEERPAPLSGPVGASASVQVPVDPAPASVPPAPPTLASDVSTSGSTYVQRAVSKNAVTTSSFGSRIRSWPVAMLAASLIASLAASDCLCRPGGAAL